MGRIKIKLVYPTDGKWGARYPEDKGPDEERFRSVNAAVEYATDTQFGIAVMRNVHGNYAIIRSNQTLDYVGDDFIEALSMARQEVRKQISETVVAREEYKVAVKKAGKRAPHCKPVRCIETGKIYESAAAASRDIGKTGNYVRSQINSFAKGYRCSRAPLHFEYLEAAS